MIFPVKGGTAKRYPDGSIFQGFGENPADYAQFGLQGHNGWDILKGLNAECVSTADGIVWEASNVQDSLKESDTRYNGNVIRILTNPDSSGKQYLCPYGHLNKILVTPGQKVKAGETIGLMGNTGFVVSQGMPFWGNAPPGKGVHLHFGIYEVKLSEQTINIMNSYNGFKGALDPTPFFTDSIKADTPEITLMQKLVELLRSFIRLKGQEPVA